MSDQASDVEKTEPAAIAEDERAPKPAKSPWITRLEAEAFRGISAPLTLNLSGDGHPSSIVILGDNGSGKSSIVDALQFGLQAEVQGHDGDKAARLARCQFVDALPKVSVELSDGTVVQREMELDDGEEKPTFDPDPVADFSNTPMVLRRADILRFWETPVSQRQLIFARYFSADTQARETPQEQIEHLEGERVRNRSACTEALAELAGVADVPQESIPTQVAEFNRWAKSHFHGAYNAKEGEFGEKRKLPKNQQPALRRARDAIRRLRSTERDLQNAKYAVADARRVPELETIVKEASGTVTEAFHKITLDSAVRRFEITSEGSAVALGIDVELDNGLRADPKVVLSEANRDLVALLIIVTIRKALGDRAKVIVLDDVFQSVDSPIRLAALEYLIRDMSGWQFIITAHDRFWREQVTDVLQRRGVPVNSFEIVEWNAEHGPAVRITKGDVDLALRQALKTGDSSVIAVLAGQLLEEISNVMSWTLGTSVKRRKDDRYSLGDLWPPVKKVLVRTDAADTATEVDLYQHLRNKAGAHSNPWAKTASLTESRRFGEGVRELLGFVWCSACGRWVEPSPTLDKWECRCGETTLRKRSGKKKGT